MHINGWLSGRTAVVKFAEYEVLSGISAHHSANGPPTGNFNVHVIISKLAIQCTQYWSTLRHNYDHLPNITNVWIVLKGFRVLIAVSIAGTRVVINHIQEWSACGHTWRCYVSARFLWEQWEIPHTYTHTHTHTHTHAKLMPAIITKESRHCDHHFLESKHRNGIPHS